MARIANRSAARLLALSSALAIMAGCAEEAPPADDVATSSAVEGIANAEDFATIGDGSWVVASSMAGGDRTSGGLYRISAETGEATLVYPLPVGEGSANGEQAPLLTPDCSTQLAANAFAPHGVTVQTFAGQETLFVVNHGGRESIELFTINAPSGDDGAPSLRWAGCIPYPAGGFGNGVTVTTDGTLYTANMGQPIGGETTSQMGGDVLSWTARDGWGTVADSVMDGPNGIVVSPDSSELFVAAWPGKQVVALNLETGARREVDVPFLPDNVKWSDTGMLLVTGHSIAKEVVMECYISTRTQCTIPSSVAVIDPATLEVRSLYEVDTDMATTALDVVSECWIGTARGNAIARLHHACDTR